MVNRSCHIRPGYGDPGTLGRGSQLGKIPTRVQVAVRQVSTGRTGKTMLQPSTETTTHRASLRTVGGIDDGHCQPHTFGLVAHEGLKLCERPPMQPGTNAFASLDVFADVREVFQNNGRSARSEGFRDDGLAGFVVDMLHVPGFATGDFAEQLFGTLRAVALKPTTKGKILVAGVTETTATDDLSGGGGSQVILAHVYPHAAATSRGRGIGEVEDNIQKPSVAFAEKFGLLDFSFGQIFCLEFTGQHRDGLPPGHGVERNDIALDGEGAGIEMDTPGGLEDNGRDLILAPELQPLVGIGYGLDGIADHLRSKRGDLPHRVIGQMV